MIYDYDNVGDLELTNTTPSAIQVWLLRRDCVDALGSDSGSCVYREEDDPRQQLLP